ncbi:MAG: DNA polymerase III subunit beta [Candidatus Lernaella stagnicola]|nr:DNA polymerase III subunit beta [Candidatus Lernaella stagnicola]
MQFTIAREELLRGLGRAQSVIEKKSTLPILSNVLVEAKGDTVTIVATDLEVGVRSVCEAAVDKDGSITVNAKKLFEICKELETDEIGFKVLSNDWVEITSGAYSSRLVGLAADDFPVLPATDTEKTITLNGSLVAEMIDKTQYAISTNETRYYLNGVYLLIATEDDKKVLRMVATDGHRLSLCDKELPEGFDVDLDGIIVPKKGVVELRKLVGEADGDVTIGFMERTITAKRSDVELIVRLIDGEYPDYRQVIPQGNDKIVTCPQDALTRATRRVAIMATELNKGVKVSLERGAIEISCNNPNLGTAHEQLDATYDGPKLEIGFNARYILDVLGVAASEDILLELSDALSPCVLRTPADSGFLAVIMPMRLE